MKRNYLVRSSVVAATLGLFSICAEATPITGLVTTDGSAVVNLTQILFSSTTGVSGVFAVGIPDTGSFSGLAGDDGTITNLTNNSTNTGPNPVGVAFNDPNWMVFSGPPTNADISFDLQFINPGDFTSTACTALVPLAGQTCTLPGSPFDLTNEGPVVGGSTITAVGITFSVSGTAVNTLTGETSHFTSGFGNSGQVLDATSGAVLTTLQQVVSSIEAGHSVTSGYQDGTSAVASGVPEPSTVVFASLGGLFLLLGSLRRKSA
jgi:hypothetical protein